LRHDNDSPANEHKPASGISRRSFFAGGAGLTAAVLASGKTEAQDQATDRVKRAQAREGYKIPLPPNWVADHVTDDVNSPVKTMPPLLTANVNATTPLKYDLFLSLNSASGYLMLDRLLALNEGFHVKMNFRPIRPRVLLNGHEGDFPYTFNYENIESQRIAKFLGVPFKYPNPQVVNQDTWPPYTRTLDPPMGEEKQKNAYYLSRMAAAAQLQDKGDAFLDSVFRMIWDGSVADWPSQIIPAMKTAGMNAEVMDADVRTNPAKYDKFLAENARKQTTCGHEGDAVAAVQQEPFPGQNRFDELYWTLLQNGMTRKPNNTDLPTTSWTG
jgi:2-hydroxychromene-2-carboxylate isomerase